MVGGLRKKCLNEIKGVEVGMFYLLNIHLITRINKVKVSTPVHPIILHILIVLMFKYEYFSI